jgi:hypothetical protein
VSVGTFTASILEEDGLMIKELGCRLHDVRIGDTVANRVAHERKTLIPVPILEISQVLNDRKQSGQ